MKALRPTTNGRAQEMGSLYRRGNRADADTFITSQMRKAGLNLIGTNDHAGVRGLQFCRKPSRLHHAQSLDYTTCRPSAGSAAVVAAGVVPIAHATDGGGSIRIPTRVNGNIGLKVSRGVFSIAPHLSDFTRLVSIPGCQSRSVRDTAAFVDACRGPAPSNSCRTGRRRSLTRS
jgi:Asp-tRNA(Asn)/Glu-tRNA(Gln) amidotransferase A subunit family amidase